MMPAPRPSSEPPEFASAKPGATAPSSGKTLLVAHERWWESLLSDAVTFCVGIGLMGVGAAFGSSAMEWAGFIGFFFFVFARGSSKVVRKSPQDAANWLRDEFGVRAE